MSEETKVQETAETTEAVAAPEAPEATETVAAAEKAEAPKKAEKTKASAESDAPKRTHRFVVRVGEEETEYEDRTEALMFAKETSKEAHGAVIVDSETERSTYRYINGELAQFVMETRR